MSIQRAVVPMATAILKAKEKGEGPNLREFQVPFKIEGKRSVWATDIDAARYLAENIQPEEYAHYGELETYDPEPVQ